uniref:Acireductone synthase n=1 Tax=Crithidia acanthocephali TaxID=59798 RepID=U5KLA1_9TRYP|nr:acireductone synthase [Crithidia acanthocephali]
MPQSIAWQCFKAQTELAHLANALPPLETYDKLMDVVQQKVTEVHTKRTSIDESLRKRGVRLQTPDSPSYECSSPDASTSESRPPIVVFLCDVEGTTTPLPFVRQVMMPLAAAHVEAYTRAHFPSDPAFRPHVAAAAAAVTAAPANASITTSPDAPPTVTLRDAFAKAEAAAFADEAANDAVRKLFCLHFRREIQQGSKEAYMKAVQAAIWEEVYATGKHRTQVYPDVNEFFRYAGDEAMRDAMHVALYSTGSVAAQQLLMRHTPYGDLNPFITAYFDPTIVGTKLTPKSYMRIRNLLAQQLNIGTPENLQIVFLTDNTSEASAADSSGAIDCPVLCIRPLNGWITIDTMLSVAVPFITSFAQLMRPEEEVDYVQLVKDTLDMLKEPSA